VKVSFTFCVVKVCSLEEKERTNNSIKHRRKCTPFLLKRTHSNYIVRKRPGSRQVANSPFILFYFYIVIQFVKDLALSKQPILLLLSRAAGIVSKRKYYNNKSIFNKHIVCVGDSEKVCMCLRVSE
jgi:hypothetical protein